MNRLRAARRARIKSWLEKQLRSPKLRFAKKRFLKPGRLIFRDALEKARRRIWQPVGICQNSSAGSSELEQNRVARLE